MEQTLRMSCKGQVGLHSRLFPSKCVAFRANIPSKILYVVTYNEKEQVWCLRYMEGPGIAMGMVWTWAAAWDTDRRSHGNWHISRLIVPFTLLPSVMSINLEKKAFAQARVGHRFSFPLCFWSPFDRRLHMLERGTGSWSSGDPNVLFATRQVFSLEDFCTVAFGRFLTVKGEVHVLFGRLDEK